MPDDSRNGYPSWVPSWVPDLFPGSTPFRDPPPCPEGTRRLIGGGCSTPTLPQPGRLVEVEPNDSFVGPVPTPRTPRPVKVPTAPPPTITPTGPSPADALPRQMPVFRGPGPGAAVLGAVRDLSIAGVMSYVWALAFGASFGFGWRERSLFDPLPQPTGPPRRTRRPGATISPNAPQPFWDQTYRPGYRQLPDWLRPIRGPFPVPGVDPSTWSVPDVRSPARPMPSRPRTVPAPSARVSPVLAPGGWTLGDPLAGPGYDPFTWTPPPAPAPHAPPRAIPRENPLDFPWPGGLLFPQPRSVPGVGTRATPRTLTPQPTPRAPPRTVRPPRTQPPTDLTPFNTPEPLSQPRYSADPCAAAANTAQREKRRRRKECKRFTTKTIRVCADKWGNVPSIVRERSVGIGATDDNLFSGSAYEFANRNRVASVGITAAATGSFATLQSGADIVAEEFAPVVKTVMPVIPDDFFFNDIMAIGDRLVLRVRNPTGGAIIHRAVANLTDLWPVPQPLNRIPPGLLEYFGIKAGGWGPRELGQVLSPTIDLFDWYLQPTALGVSLSTTNPAQPIAATLGNSVIEITATSPTNLSNGTRILVPSTEIWLILEANITWAFTANAGNSADFGFFSHEQNGNGVVLTWPMVRSGNVTSLAAAALGGRATLDHPFWVVGDSRIAIDCYGAVVVAGSVTLGANLRLVRFSR